MLGYSARLAVIVSRTDGHPPLEMIYPGFVLSAIPGGSTKVIVHRGSLPRW